VAGNPGIEHVYVFEYDHLILRPDFEDLLTGLARSSAADLLAKAASDRTGTNWAHYTRFRRDPDLLAFLASISVREDPTRLYGCLGNGFLLTRAALGAFAAVENPPPCYVEVYLPTVLHHLGFRVVDIDALSDVYRHVTWEPERTLDEVLTVQRAGGYFAHPFKDIATLDRVTAARAHAAPTLGGREHGSPAR